VASLVVEAQVVAGAYEAAVTVASAIRLGRLDQALGELLGVRSQSALLSVSPIAAGGVSLTGAQFYSDLDAATCGPAAAATIAAAPCDAGLPCSAASGSDACCRLFHPSMCALDAGLFGARPPAPDPGRCSECAAAGAAAAAAAGAAAAAAAADPAACAGCEWLSVAGSRAYAESRMGLYRRLGSAVGNRSAWRRVGGGSFLFFAASSAAWVLGDGADEPPAAGLFAQDPAPDPARVAGPWTETPPGGGSPAPVELAVACVPGAARAAGAGRGPEEVLAAGFNFYGDLGAGGGDPPAQTLDPHPGPVLVAAGTNGLLLTPGSVLTDGLAGGGAAAAVVAAAAQLSSPIAAGCNHVLKVGRGCTDLVYT
jgi:hypothetical protein